MVTYMGYLTCELLDYVSKMEETLTFTLSNNNKQKF